ncbi:PHP domain-containing protein [Bifidobacterium sp. MA2]|uniref:PHP domain-containing protein n=1 Tax=Bifidobacterium santillanense TaxID=2809028 RepID=A0ABS5ULQ4_9BIFI|nr:PHP domain-containing protein [Bifidobacterium santillanense]MBT1171841.1 PHP domain-containing protein [Bifidobacterium santillanense]
MMSVDDFAHLHVHSVFSMTDGGSTVDELVTAAANMGQPAIGLTDHGCVSGLFDFWKACRKTGIKPVLGLEAYVTPETDRRDASSISWERTPGERRNPDDVGGNGRFTHLSLWAETDEGLSNLLAMSAAANLEGRVGRYPRVDQQLLAQYATGLICGSGCPSGAIQTRLRLGQFDDALRMAGELQDIFGRNSFFIEIMDHGLEIERRVRSGLLEIADKLNAPIVATADAHYAKAADRMTQELRLCIESECHWDDPDRFRFDGDGYYLKSGEEMRQLFSDIPEACDNTLRIAERCEANFHPQPAGSLMPTSDYGPGKTANDAIRELAENGLRRLGVSMTDDVRERVAHELHAIRLVNAEEYLLAVADVKHRLQEEGHTFTPGEGIAAASLVCYALGITQVNPLKRGVTAQSFINEKKPVFPILTLRTEPGLARAARDILTERYGDDHVASTVAYTEFGRSNAVRAVARVLEYDGASDGSSDVESADTWLREQRHMNVQDRIARFPQRRFVRESSIVLSARPLPETTSLIQQVDGTVATALDLHACDELGIPRLNILGSIALAHVTDEE